MTAPLASAPAASAPRASAPQPRPGILDIVPYKPGKAGKPAPGRKLHKLSSNESGLGPSPAGMAAFADVAGALEMYPDGAAGRLKAKIAEVHGLEEDRLYVGAGSDEIISNLCRAYAGEGRSIVQTRHGFSYYWLAAKAAGAEPLFAPETDLHADVDAILKTVREDTGVVFLANPNNPTGTLIPASEVRRLREELPDGVILAIDGAYAEYMDPEGEYEDGVALVRERIEGGQRDTLMMRTFSKIYGLGGLRVGWAYAPEEMIGVFDRIRSPFNVNAPALAAAEAALGDQDFVRRNRAHNEHERARVRERAGALGFESPTPSANFVLLRMRGETDDARAGEAERLIAHLERDGIMVRSVAGAWLPGYVRVSVGSTEANDAFLESLERFAAA